MRRIGSCCRQKGLAGMERPCFGGATLKLDVQKTSLVWRVRFCPTMSSSPPPQCVCRKGTAWSFSTETVMGMGAHPFPSPCKGKRCWAFRGLVEETSGGCQWPLRPVMPPLFRAWPTPLLRMVRHGWDPMKRHMLCRQKWLRPLLVVGRTVGGVKEVLSIPFGFDGSSLLRGECLRCPRATIPPPLTLSLPCGRPPIVPIGRRTPC